MEIMLGNYTKKNKIESFMSKIRTTIDYEILVPNDILSRTELMCMFVQEEIKEYFGIDEFLMLLYQGFINYAVKNPNPDRICREATRKKVKRVRERGDEVIKIVINEKEYIEKKEGSLYVNEDVFVNIRMPKYEAKKGQLILSELYSIKGIYVGMEELLANLWINFIEDYKDGTNKRAYRSLVKILKEVIR